MSRLAIVPFCAACGAVVVLATGCASQSTVAREWYEPTESTAFKRDDGTTVGALKSETVKSGQPDWSGNKTFSLFSW